MGDKIRKKRNVSRASTYLGFLTLQYIVIIPAILKYVKVKVKVYHNRPRWPKGFRLS